MGTVTSLSSYRPRRRLSVTFEDADDGGFDMAWDWTEMGQQNSRKFISEFCAAVAYKEGFRQEKPKVRRAWWLKLLGAGK